MFIHCICMGPERGATGSRSGPGSLPLITYQWIQLLLDSLGRLPLPLLYTVEGLVKYLNKVFQS